MESGEKQMSETAYAPHGQDLQITGNPAELFAAIAKARLKFDSVSKDRNGQAGQGKFLYAPMHNLVAASAGALGSEGVVTMQALTTPAELKDEGRHRLTTMVAGHGAVITVVFDFAPVVGDIKAYGAQTTYLRRYAYNCIWLLDGVEDADEVAESTPSGVRQEQARKPPTQPPAPKPAAGKPSGNPTPASPGGRAPESKPAESTPVRTEAETNRLADEAVAKALAEKSAARLAEETAQKAALDKAAKAAEVEPVKEAEAADDDGFLPPDTTPESEVVGEFTSEMSDKVRDLVQALGIKRSEVLPLMVKAVGVGSPKDLDSRTGTKFIAYLEQMKKTRG